MITNKQADIRAGTAAHWEVNSPSMLRIDWQQDANRMGGKLVTYDANTIIDSQTFGHGLPIMIILPVGTWKFESSSDGKTYREVTKLASHDNPPYGPSQHVNLTLDGQPFPAVWNRYTKV